MAYQIRFKDEAEAQIQALSARERSTLEATIFSTLQYQPTLPTKSIKRLRPNPIAEFELRVGDLRVLYNVEGDIVHLLVVGRKVRDKLLVEGEEYYEHHDNPAEPSGNGAPGDAE